MLLQHLGLSPAAGLYTVVTRSGIATRADSGFLVEQACALMLRHMSQRSRVMNDLQMVQVKPTAPSFRV